jgi:hypothetical protein
MRSLESPENENRENLSALLKDVSDEKRKRLRVKAVCDALKDARGMLLEAVGARGEK